MSEQGKRLSLTMAAKAWHRYLVYRGSSEWHGGPTGAHYDFTGRKRRDIQGIKACLFKSGRVWYRTPGWAHPT